jgi:uncharacterized protein (TIGR04255 family)
MNLRTKLPVRLGKEPLLEAIWQLRFQPEQQVVSEILTGAIFQGMRSDLKTTERLFFGVSLPKNLTDLQPNLLYAPSIRLNGERFSVGIGERMVSLSAKLPYCGWAMFSEKISQLTSILDATQVDAKLENFSMKYIDCLVEPVATSLSALAIQCAIADRGFKGEPMLIRTEFTEMAFKHVVQVVLPATVTLADLGQKRSGIVIDVESFCARPSEMNGLHSWISSRLDELHTANKRMFFSLLTDETVELLDPIYNKEVN